MGDDHPEAPKRVSVIREKVVTSTIANHLQYLTADRASDEHILSVHGARYLEQLKTVEPAHGLVQADEDTFISPNTMDAAYRAAGSGIQAVDGIMRGDYKRAFCAVRPPGHHAEPELSKGFCFFNNVAIAAEHAMSAHQLKRVAIIDFDVHQCNGTIECFKHREDVLICSSFQHPFYPNSHWSIEQPQIRLTPIVSYADFRDVHNAWLDDWLPALIAHEPDIIFISAGFDAHTNDPLGQTNWQTKDYEWLTQQIVEAANSLCKGRIVSMLEGGYHLDTLADCALSHIRALDEQR